VMNSHVNKPPMASLSPRERSVGELFSELAVETSTLVRQEVKLATTELTQKATYAAKQGAFIAIGSVFGALSLFTLFGALVLGIGTVIPLWASVLLFGILFAAVASGLVIKGVTALRNADLAPKQTLQSIEENKSWILEQIR